MTTTIPGGYYLSPDGKSAHDANGKKIPLIPIVEAADNSPIPGTVEHAQTLIPAEPVIPVKAAKESKTK